MKVNKERAEEKMNKKIVFLISIATITFFALVGIVYAKYQKDINITYKATTGEMICDVEIINEGKEVNGIPYFLVKIKNYDENNNLTATNIDYTLTISSTDSKGMFIWQNEEKGDYINTYLKTVTTNTYSFEKTEKEYVFKVFVKNSESVTDASDINVNVELNAIQKEGNQ